MQLNTTLLNDYCKIYVAAPEYTDVDALTAYVRVHRTELMQELHQYGILLFRGFKLQRHYEFHELIEYHFQLEPWHTFTPKNQVGLPLSCVNIAKIVQVMIDLISTTIRCN